MLERLLAATVGDLGLRTAVMVTPATPVRDVIEALREAHRGAALVEDGKGTLLGIFTERDVLLKLDPADPSLDQPVSSVMTANPVTVQVGASLTRTLAKMGEGRFRHLPIVRGDRQVLGLVSVRDILTWVALHFPEAVQNLPPEPRRGASGRWGG
jgi:CBS domain-containing protein